MAELARHFCEKIDIEAHLLLYGRNPEIFYRVPENLIVHKPHADFNRKLRILATFGRLRFIRQEIVKISPNTVLSFGEIWNSFVLLALSGLNYPVYISDRCRPDKHLGFIHEILRKWLYPKAKGIIVQTSKAKEIYQSLFQFPSIKVIGNPIREITVRPEIQKENIVLTVGRLIPSKNHARLIESFVKLNKPAWKLVIVGGNALKMDLKGELQLLINKLGAGENVILTGNLKDVDNYFLKSKIFVLTSDSEGFPNVLGEAMSAGLPVVAFDCVAGPSEMINNGIDGFLLPVFDFNSLEEKVLTLMDDKDLREQMGREAMSSIKRFSINHIGEMYYSFITSTN